MLAGQRSRLEKPTEQEEEEGELEVMKQDVQAFAMDDAVDEYYCLKDNDDNDEDILIRMTPISIVHNWPIIIM